MPCDDEDGRDSVSEDDGVSAEGPAVETAAGAASVTEDVVRTVEGAVHVDAVGAVAEVVGPSSEMLGNADTVRNTPSLPCRLEPPPSASPSALEPRPLDDGEEDGDAAGEVTSGRFASSKRGETQWPTLTGLRVEVVCSPGDRPL